MWTSRENCHTAIVVKAKGEDEVEAPNRAERGCEPARIDCQEYRGIVNIVYISIYNCDISETCITELCTPHKRQ